MSAETQSPARPRRGQNPAVKGNPYAAVFLRARADRDEYLVESASGNAPYVTAIHHEIPDLDTCSCEAPRECWHKSAARLRQQIERVEANSLGLYRDWGVVALANEDARLREELAAADSWLVRAQLGVVGDLIGTYFTSGSEVA